MNKTIIRFIVIPIVVVVAWVIGKMNSCPLRVRTSCEVSLRLQSRDRIQRVACKGSPILAPHINKSIGEGQGAETSHHNPISISSSLKSRLLFVEVTFTWSTRIGSVRTQRPNLFDAVKIT